jgi:methylmalonyl-CoA mutase N-terminal domain/subunit
MTINATGAILLLLYELVAEEQGVAGEARRHHPERHPEGVHRAGDLHLPAPALHAAHHRHVLLLRQNLPSWNTISISGYHIREAGSTAVQEIAFTIANGIAYVEAAMAAGLDVDAFAPRLSFFWNAHNNLFEEVAKYRAARRMWARIMTERFGAKDERSKTVALPHPDGRLDPHRPAAREQHRPGDGAGHGRRTRGHPEPPYQRL